MPFPARDNALEQGSPCQALGYPSPVRVTNTWLQSGQIRAGHGVPLTATAKAICCAECLAKLSSQSEPAAHDHTLKSQALFHMITHVQLEPCAQPHKHASSDTFHTPTWLDGMVVLGGTTAPAATMAPAPTTEPSNTVAPMPTSTLSPIVAACTVAPWPACSTHAHGFFQGRDVLNVRVKHAYGVALCPPEESHEYHYHVQF